MKLCIASKQFCATGSAGIDAVGFGVGVFANEWSFSSGFAYGVNLAAGAGYDWNNFRVSWTYYNNIGNDEGADMNFLSVGYRF